ncbi:lectin-like protein, partial [Flavobacteriales bacterium]|nr:lectin-like protein [Flavobacteriales bacterium]
PPIISAGADQTVCAGSDVTLTGSGAITYIWDNGVLDGEPFTPPSTANYVLTATEPFGTIATIGNQFETSNGTSGNFQGQSFTTGSSNALLLSITTNAIGGSSGAQLANGIAGSILNIRTYVNDVETGTNHAVTGTILATASNPSILNTNYQAPSSKFIFDSTLTLTANTRYVIEFVSGSGVGIYSRLHSVSSGNDEYTGGQAYDIDGFNQSFVRDYPFLITTLENTNISGPNGCSATDMVTVTVNPQEDATFAYSGSSYCADDSDPNPVNPTPIISGTTGGVFSSTAGLSINSSTGQVDLDASTPGTYTITYSTPGANCSATSTQDVTITTSSTDFNYGGDTEFCLGTTNLVATITGASGGTFSATGGLTIDASTGQIDLSTAIAGNYQVTYTSASSGNFQQIGQDIDGEATGDSFGNSISLSHNGKILAVGGYQNDGINGTNSGHVKVFEFTNGIWSQLGGDIDGENINDASGYSVSLNNNGSRVAIGATINSDNGSNSGHVRIYEWQGNVWSQLGSDIDGEAAGDYSGQSVSLNASGNIVAIGARENNGINGPNSGHVRVYQLNGNVWAQLGQDIDGEQPYSDFGYSVSLSRDGLRVSVGAPDNQGSGVSSGHTRIYELNGNIWTQLGQDIDGEYSGDESGKSVSLNAVGDIVAIGARGNDDNGNNSGHVRIYRWNVNTWSQVGQDIEGENMDQAGVVDISNSGNLIAVGGPGSSENGLLSGNVRIYEFNGTLWNQLGSDIYGESSMDFSGSSLSINGNGAIIAIGSTNHNNTGHVRIFGAPTAVCSQPLNITIHAAPSIDLGADTTLICDNTSQTLDAGTGFASYLWSDGSTNQTLLVSNSATYTVTGTDANGCTAQDSVHLDLLVGEIVQSDTTICEGDIITLNAINQNNAQYLWSPNNETTSSVTVSPSATTTYTLDVTSGSTTCQDIVIVTVDAHPVIDLGNDTTICNNGSIVLNPGSGDTFLWSDNSTNQTLTATTTGIYDVTVTDNNGCSATDNITVNIAPSLSVTVSGTNVTCNGLNNGTATVIGGTANDTYLWNDQAAQNTQTATNLSPGNYSVTVTANNNCQSTGSITIGEPTLLSATTQQPPQFADFTYIGEYQNHYIYYHNARLNWLDARQKCLNNGGDLLVINNAQKQSHYASILNSNSWIGLYQDVNDPNYSEPSGGWKWVDGTPLTFENWNSGEPNNVGGEDYGHFTGGNHFWNDLPLSSNLPFTMQLDKSAANILSVTCNGGSNGQTYVTGAGGTLPYNYLWNDALSQTTDTAINLSPGNYSVTITDSNGCTASDVSTITEPNIIIGKDVQFACDSYTWIDGNIYTASNNSATDTLIAANGCDSIV